MKIFKGTLEECNAAISNLNSALNYPNDKGTLRAATPKQKEETETYWFAVDKEHIYNALTDDEKLKVEDE
jgi:hypothetical protein|tara:strand:+ start:841 stop:1050 length:210 start_codon:yes stop_codon:yes gene_type:complete